MSRALDRTNPLFRPQHPSARYDKLDTTCNPKRNLHSPRSFRDEPPRNGTNKNPHKRQNPSIPLYVLPQGRQERRVGRDVMQHTGQDHRRHFGQS